jgi:hypothetical protein
MAQTSIVQNSLIRTHAPPCPDVRSSSEGFVQFGAMPIDLSQLAKIAGLPAHGAPNGKSASYNGGRERCSRSRGKRDKQDRPKHGEGRRQLELQRAQAIQERLEQNLYPALAMNGLWLVT